GGQQRDASEDRGIPPRRVQALQRFPGRGPGRIVERRAVARPEQPSFPPRGGVRERRQQREQREDQHVPGPARHYLRSWPEAICSEMRPNRNTTTASWIRSAEPMGILPCTAT